MEKVSVIVPVYNNYEFLPFNLHSIYNGSYQNLEIIVVENQSNDEVQSIINTFDPAAKYIIVPGGNRSKIKNVALSASSGEFVTFLNPNDVNGKMRIELEVKKFEDLPDIEMVFCGSTYINEENSFLPGVSKTGKFSEREFFGFMLLKNQVVSLSSVLFKRSLFKTLTPFDESLPVMENYDLFLRAAAQHKVFYIDLPLLRKRILSGQKEHDPESIQKAERRILQKHSLNDLAAGLARLNKNEKDFRSAMGYVLLKRGDYKASADNLLRAITLDPDNIQLYFHLAGNFYEQGKIDEAVRYYKNTLALKPDHKASLAMMKKLNAIQKIPKKLKKTMRFKFKPAMSPLEQNAVGV